MIRAITANLPQRWWVRSARFAVIAVPVIAAFLAVIFWQQVRIADQLRAAEIEAQDQQAMMMAVLSAHQDLETGQRGYLLTGKDEFLLPFTAGSNELDRIIPQVRDAFAKDKAQRTRFAALERLSHSKREFSRRLVDLRRNGHAEESIAMVAGGHGKRLMDDIRDVVDAMLLHETRSLGTARARIERVSYLQRWGAALLVTVLILLLIAAALAIWRTLETRYAALIAAQDNAARQQAVFDAAMDSIFTLNTSGTIETLNAAATRMFGYSEEELQRRDIGKLFAGEMPIGAAAEALRAMQLAPGRQGQLQRIIGRRKDGTTFATDTGITLVHLADGLRYVAVVRDASESDRVERMKSEFVSTVSHELRTPLTSIAGSLGLLAGGAAGELAEKPARLITIARNNADRLVRLINDILDVEKLESGKMRFDSQRIELGEALAHSVESLRAFAEGYGVTIALERPDRPVHALVDRDRLDQVCVNLLSNAIKFSPQGGTVTLALVPGDLTHRIIVQDQGPGIPLEFQPRIFGKFAQADSSDSRAKGGTGLGLSIVREITMRMGGAVGFDSEPGQGSTFFVDLPSAEPNISDNVPAIKTAKLLVCGGADAPELLRALQHGGFDLALADSVHVATQMLEQSDFDLVLLDMELPQSGAVEIIRAARISNDAAGVPILALGMASAEHETGDAAIVEDWLHKSLQRDEILARLNAALARQGSGKPRVLHVDDDPDVLRIVTAAFGERAEVTPAASLSEARAKIAAQTFDLAILDLTLRDGKGVELLGDLRDAAQGPVPVVVFSAEDADVAAAESFAAFLTKSRTPVDALVTLAERLAQESRRKTA